MNTQNQVHEMQAGEALALPGSSTARAILVEGEVLFQPCALYLAGTVVLPPVRRIRAPASLPLAQAGSLVAASSARVVVEEAPSAFAVFAALRAWLQRRAPRSIAAT